MKKGIFIILFLFFLPFLTSAAMSPANKECMQRGNKILDGYCLLPEGTKCKLPEFNNGSCGEEYKIENYCIKQGGPVWDMDKCCFGLKPTQPTSETGEVLLGHPTCQPATYSFILNPYFYLYFLISILIMLLLIWAIIKKKKIT